MGTTTDDIARSASDAAEDAAPWVERLARVGFVAKGVLYGTIGLLALSAAIGNGGGATDTQGAMGRVVQAPFGRVLMAIIAIGLLGYAVWRVVQGIADPEHRGTDAKGIALRSSFVARGITHGALAFTAAATAMRGSEQGGNGERSEDMASRLLDVPGGRWLLLAVGVGVVAFGLYQVYRAAVAKLSKQLDQGRMSAETGRWVIAVSRFGIAARGLVFGSIGFLVARAAWRHNPNDAGGIEDGLRKLMDLGRWPFAAIAVGVIAYGVYELLNARYRRIRAT